MYLFPKKNRECIFIKGKQVLLGTVMDFTITKTLLIEEEEYYIFTDSTKDNFLVPAEYYYDYKFQIGQAIKGWVDKINCSGRIFIEPFHPHYNIGETYDFELLRCKYSNEESSENKIIFVVRDKLGLEWDAKGNKKLQILPSSILCRVDKIKKGQLYLTVQL